MFKTTSEQEIKDVLSIKVEGLSHTDTEYQIVLDKETYKKCIKEALKDAKKNATMITQEYWKQVGEIVKIVQNSAYDIKPTWSGSMITSSHVLLEVVFELL